MILKNVSSLHSITEGGEGVIYEHKGKIVKIYKPCINLASKEKKIKLLISKSLPPSVIAPIEEVYDGKNRFIGFVMEKVSGEDFKKLSTKKFVNANHITTKDILSMLIKVKDVLDVLHKNNIYVGDLNDQNILFDKNYNIYFIDCDSWTIDTEKCEVAMDLFKDPLLKSNNFDASTDTYSFAVLAWKVLTRIHPFGGTMNPDMSITDRMVKGISVIDNPAVKIPRTIKSWRNLSPDLINTFKQIFENKSRSIGSEFEDMFSNLKFCKVDDEYYFGKYITCPLCDASAKINQKTVSQGVMSGLNLVIILSATNVDTVLNEYSYIDKNNNVVDVRSNTKIPFVSGQRYYFTESGKVVIDYYDRFEIESKDNCVFEKKFKSNIVVNGNKIYYLNKQNALAEVTVYEQGNNIKKVTQCAITSYFEIADDKYCVINVYDNKILVSCNGYNTEFNHNNQITNYGMHYDESTDSWLVVLEDVSGKFRTMVFNKTDIIYDTDRIKYQCHLNNLCFSRNTIFIPIDGKIRGYNYSKDVFKDFECGVVDADSKLIRKGKKFVIINDDSIYNLG